MKQRIWQRFFQLTWIVILALIVWTFMGPGDGILASSNNGMNQPVLRVRIYNYAHIDRLALHDAKGQAAGILAKAGVRIAWTVFSQKPGRGWRKADNSSADFFLRILPASMARRCNYKPGALGESLIRPGKTGTLPGGTANVFYGRVKHVSLLWGLSPGEVLGDAIAHELGHLLGACHSKRGIMKSPWTLRDVQLASRGQLRFSPGQVAGLQDAVQSLQRNRPVRLVAKR